VQLQALELHRADAALGPHRESVEALLAQLFAADAPDAAEGALQGALQRLAGWLAGWLTGRLTGWLAGCYRGGEGRAAPPQQVVPLSNLVFLQASGGGRSRMPPTISRLCFCVMRCTAPLRCTAGMGQGRSRMLDLLELVTRATPEEPQLGRDAHPEVRRMLQVRGRGMPCGCGWGRGRVCARMWRHMGVCLRNSYSFCLGAAANRGFWLY